MKNLAQTVTVFCLLKLLSWCPALPLAIAPCTASQTAEETQHIRMPTTSSKQITSLQFLTLQGEMGSEEQGTLPCLDSSPECVEKLTQSAIAIPLIESDNPDYPDYCLRAARAVVSY